MKQFGKIVFIIAIVLCIAGDIGYIAIKTNYSSAFSYKTYFWGTSNNVPEDQEKIDPDSKFTFVIDYWENADGQGAEMLEIKVNYFTDYQFTDVYSLGVQILNPSNMVLNTNGIGFWDGHLVIDEDYGLQMANNATYSIQLNGASIAYFNTDDNVSFKATSTFNDRNVPFIIDIDNKPYAFDFNKVTKERHGNLWYCHSNFDYFLYRVFDATSHLTSKDMTYQYLKLELTDVFNLYKYSQTSGKFDILSDLGYEVDYIKIKLNYHSRGVYTHEDSQFGQIGNDRTGGVIWGK